jgi:DNA-binding NarL/FixJ family response regulator
MSDFDVEVKTWLPSSQWKQLHRVALENNTTVGHLVRELVRRQLVGQPAATPTSRRYGGRLTAENEAALRRLHAAGMSDVAIGRELGVSNGTVGVWRTRLRLQKTSAGGRPKKQSTTPDRDSREQAHEGEAHV